MLLSCWCCGSSDRSALTLSQGTSQQLAYAHGAAMALSAVTALAMGPRAVSSLGVMACFFQPALFLISAPAYAVNRMANRNYNAVRTRALVPMVITPLALASGAFHATKVKQWTE